MIFSTPVGRLLAVCEGEALTALEKTDAPAGGNKTALTLAVQQQLNEYFAGERTCFTIPLAPVGTPFQRQVWQALCKIPYGETYTYGQLAATIGNPHACRAVGMANHRNPIAIMIPCHRVIGADGTLTGYAGGLEMKRFLLELEQKSRL